MAFLRFDGQTGVLAAPLSATALSATLAAPWTAPTVSTPNVVRIVLDPGVPGAPNPNYEVVYATPTNGSATLTLTARGQEGTAGVIHSIGAVWDHGPTAASVVAADATQTWTGLQTFAAGSFLDQGAAIYNVLAYGAKGDGVTDDTAAVAAAIVASGGGGTVYFPGGYTFLINQITIDRRVRLLGAGKTSSTIKAAVGAVGPLINANCTAFRPGFSLVGFTVDMTNAPTQQAIYCHQVRNGVINNVAVTGGTIGLQLDTVQAMNVEDCDFLNCSVSGFVGSNASSSGVTLVNCFGDNTTAGATAIFDFQGGIDWWCFGCKAFRAPGSATIVNYGFRAAYAVANTNATVAFVRCSADGMSDGSSGSAGVAGYFFQNVGNSIMLGCHSSGFSLTDGTHNAPLKIDGCNSLRIQDSWLSGRGILFTGGVSDSVKVSNCQFYGGDTGGAWFNLATPPTNLDETGNTYGNGSANMPRMSSLSTYLGAITRNTQVAHGLNVERISGASFETVSPYRVNSNNGAFTSGTLYLFAVWLPQGWPVGTLSWFSGATALTNGTSPHYWVALYDKNLALLGQSADSTAAAIPANSLISTALAAPVVTTYSGVHYVGVMVNSGTGGTQPTYAYDATLSAMTNWLTRRAVATTSTGLAGTAPASTATATNIGQLLYANVS